VRGGKADNLLTASESAYVGTHRHAWMLRPRWNDSLRPQRLHWQVTLGSLPPALDGLSILHLSDLHMAPTYDQRFFAEVLQSCTADDFDLVLFTGDLVEHPDAIAWVEPMLSRLRGRLGQFAILGNHDLHYGEAAIRAAVVAAGFVDLDGRWQCVTDPVTGATIRLGGTSAPWGPALAAPVEADTAADLTIVLSHTPDQFPRIKRWGSADIVLCGHNHGGQIRLPLIGPVLMPSIYSRRFDQGFFQSDDTLMYVSRGLGAKFPLRWRCRPEITSFTIKSAREREAKTYRRAAEAIASQL
jgi:predicted MPP superfamily phosphohydrolase